jgi:hypothetical protein
MIKSFHLLVGPMCTFYELKSPKMPEPLNISENGYFQVLEFHRPSGPSGRQNHWSLVCIIWTQKTPAVRQMQSG